MPPAEIVHERGGEPAIESGLSTCASPGNAKQIFGDTRSLFYVTTLALKKRNEVAELDPG